jgi:hypothetical protein
METTEHETGHTEGSESLSGREEMGQAQRDQRHALQVFPVAFPCFDAL